jgi:hypothetical protein
MQVNLVWVRSSDVAEEWTLVCRDETIGTIHLLADDEDKWYAQGDSMSNFESESYEFEGDYTPKEVKAIIEERACNFFCNCFDNCYININDNAFLHVLDNPLIED